MPLGAFVHAFNDRVFIRVIPTSMGPFGRHMPQAAVFAKEPFIVLEVAQHKCTDGHTSCALLLQLIASGNVFWMSPIFFDFVSAPIHPLRKARCELGEPQGAGVQRLKVSVYRICCRNEVGVKHRQLMSNCYYGHQLACAPFFCPIAQNVSSLRTVTKPNERSSCEGHHSCKKRLIAFHPTQGDDISNPVDESITPKDRVSGPVVPVQHVKQYPGGKRQTGPAKDRCLPFAPIHGGIHG